MKVQRTPFTSSGRDVGAEDADFEMETAINPSIYDGRTSIAGEHFRLHRGFYLYKCQIRAMFMKMMGYFRGNYRLLLIVYVVVVSFVGLAILRNEDYSTREDLLRSRENEALGQLNQMDPDDGVEERRYFSEVNKHNPVEVLAQVRSAYAKAARYLDQNARISMKMQVIDYNITLTMFPFFKVYEIISTLETRLNIMLRLNVSVFSGFAIMFAAVYFVLFYVKVRGLSAV